MATSRSYRDNCGMAHALDLIGERWALLVIRELMFGPKRFSDLKSDLPGISTNILTDRLAELEANYVLARRRLPPPSGAKVYELTAWGLELEPVIRAIGRWGASSPTMPHDDHVSAATIVMSLRTNFRPVAGVTAHLCLRFAAESFVVDVVDGAVRAERGESRPGDVIVTTEPAVLAGLLYGGLDPAAAVRDGRLVVDGGIEAVRDFLGQFALPPTAVFAQV